MRLMILSDNNIPTFLSFSEPPAGEHNNQQHLQRHFSNKHRLPEHPSNNRNGFINHDNKRPHISPNDHQRNDDENV